MSDLEQLQIPPTDLEIAALMEAAREGLNPAGMMILRRLAFDRDRLKEILHADTDRTLPDTPKKE